MGQNVGKGIKFKDLLKESLPNDVLSRIPRSFYVVGDIALLSLDEDIAVRYGREIAKAIMQLHPSIKSVYARGPRKGVERVTPLIHLGGERKTRTLHREYGVVIAVDIERAYFNPALGEEHKRVSDSVPDNSVVLDLFTGVGPFALHIAKKRTSYVIAMDINPYAISLLRESIALNKLKGFVEPIVIDSIALLTNEGFRKESVDVAIMNLPLEAHKYVGYALKLVRTRGRIHVYTVARTPDEARSKVVNECSTVRVIEVRRVLDYAPRKYVFRVTLEKV